MLLSLLVIIGLFALLWGTSVWFTNRHNAKQSQSMTGGIVTLRSASKMLDDFERHGNIPIYFPDVSGRGKRGVYLTHVGDRSGSGWIAFLAQVPGEDSSCQWEWNVKTERFDASCDPTRHADRSGTGLKSFPAKVVDGKVQLDLRSSAARAASTSQP